MNFLLIENQTGGLSFVGRLHTDRVRPSLLAVCGAFPTATYLHDLVSTFAGANVLVANMPGMAATPWANPTLAEATEALQRAVALLLPTQPIVALGVSTGNLLTLGLDLPNIRRRVAVEPFFETEGLWPFIANSRERMALNPDNAAMARFFWDMFGIAQDRLENRDYRHLLGAIAVPTDVIVGAEPMQPEREAATWPSFITPEDRAALAANPWVTLIEGPPGSGHSYCTTPGGEVKLRQVLHAALHGVVQYCAS
ncbi:alpha/beta hydrolase [Phenylobacterium sp.]|uniref:alpha/beta hydrolase n=1 Tax=Phenylobacterium sp. TaxID=1871053 RepID=UPI0011F9C211|nr:alpha/beta hydrolase [Phenylobacterium sp.]THD60182.1 MAG: alpha/beta hydrolase [Phenylobacterium sp.]